MKLCLNIDWLEVFCNEGGEEKDPSFFEKQGFETKVRDYGTPQYAQMFFLSRNKNPFFEIRRNPYSLKENGGIFHKGDCHIRLSNRLCYEENPIDILRAFLIAFKYTYKGLSRVDIARDFQEFDDGSSPESFLKKYMEGVFSKLNQCNIAAHGRDRWEGREWNSLSWGSLNSPIRTRFYNKTLEMKQTKHKHYIERQWEAAEADPTRDVWRTEFEIKSEIKGYVKTETGEFIRSDINTYDSREKIYFMFLCMAEHYFNFRKVIKSRDGNFIRKSRCPKLNLFSTSRTDFYKPAKLPQLKDPTRTDRLFIKKLRDIINSKEYTNEEKTIAAEMIKIIKQRIAITC